MNGPPTIAGLVKQAFRLAGGLVVVAVVGCALLPVSSTPRGSVIPSGQGSVRQFTFSKTGDAALPLPGSEHLVVMLSASGSAPPPFNFRVQGEHGFGGESKFTADSYKWPPPKRHPIKTTQAGFAIGSKLDFWVNTGDSTALGDCLRRTSLAYFSSHAYYFVDEGPVGNDALCGRAAPPPPAQEQLRALAAAFEAGFPDSPDSPVPGAAPIYQTVTQLFGPDPVGGGIDGDPRTFIVISPAVDKFGQDKGLLGYFWSRDVQPRTGFGQTDPRAHSNERETVFLTSQIFNQRPTTTFGTLAHEFTHLIIYFQRAAAGFTSEETWWDEALAMFSMDRSGYGLKAGNEDIAKDVRSFLEQPGSYSLTQWNQNPHGFAYGLAYLYARFLFDRHGQDFIREVIAIPDGGVAAIDRALRKRGSTFEQAYSEFMVSVYTSGTRLQVDARYRLGVDISMYGNYGNIELRGVRTTKIGPEAALDGVRLKPWGTSFYEMTQEGTRPWTLLLRVPGPFFGSAIGY